MMNGQIIIITGPTATGKSDIAIKVANEYNGKIINCDSKQIYKEIPIITAQPIETDMHIVPHSLYGYISITQHQSVIHWLNDVKAEIDITINNKQTPIITGGSGLYIDCLINGVSNLPKIEPEIRKQVLEIMSTEGSHKLHEILQEHDKESAEKLSPNDKHRLLRAVETFKQTGIPFSQVIKNKQPQLKESYKVKTFVVMKEREELYKKINKRFDCMVNEGILEEASTVIKMNLPNTLPALKAHGLPELMRYLNGDISLNEAIEKAKQNTRNYAKRQTTWCKNQLPNADFVKNHEEVCSKIKQSLETYP